MIALHGCCSYPMTDVQKMTYRLDVGDERLWEGDRPVQISNKAFQLLRLFVSNPNRLLTKEYILEEIWPDLCVSEGLIKEYVHDLRMAFGDSAKTPRFIETVHGRGYRFLGGVEEGRTAAHAEVSTDGAHPPPLVVLPFTNLTEDERWARFCRGLSDDLVTDLARYPDIMVIGHHGSSSNSTDGSDEDVFSGTPGVRYVLSGSVQASDSQVRVNVRLTECENKSHLWTDRYERELGDYFAIQSDIVAHVAHAIGSISGQIPHAERLRLARKQPDDLEAYEVYLLGYELEMNLQRESALRGFDLLQRAVKLEPDFARAWLVLGWLCWQIAMEHWADDALGYRRLKYAAYRKAAALDPLDPFALMEVASVRAIEGDTAGAGDALERALDLGRNQADLLTITANYIATLMDDPVRARKILQEARSLSPVASRFHHLSLTRIAYFEQAFECAVESAKRSPECLPIRLFEILATAQLGRAEVAELARVFAVEYPAFHPREYLDDHPITARGARKLFLEGVEKAGLDRL